MQRLEPIDAPRLTAEELEEKMRLAERKRNSVSKSINFHCSTKFQIKGVKCHHVSQNLLGIGCEGKDSIRDSSSVKKEEGANDSQGAGEAAPAGQRGESDILFVSDCTQNT